MQAAKASPGVSRFQRFLDLIERTGNALPHPTTLFALLAALVLVLSWVLHAAGVQVVHPGTGKMVGVVNLLSLDGLQIGRAALGTPTPVDPGKHVVEAKAPGKKPWSETVEIGAASDNKTVTVPVLEVEPGALAGAPPAAPPPSSATPDASPDRASGPQRNARRGRFRFVHFVAISAGASIGGREPGTVKKRTFQNRP